MLLQKCKESIDLFDDLFNDESVGTRIQFPALFPFSYYYHSKSQFTTGHRYVMHLQYTCKAALTLS